jgi:hypothetical protein
MTETMKESDEDGTSDGNVARPFSFFVDAKARPTTDSFPREWAPIDEGQRSALAAMDRLPGLILSGKRRTGKTSVAAMIVAETMARGRRTCVVGPNKEIADLKSALEKLGVADFLLLAGKPPEASRETLARRLSRLPGSYSDPGKRTIRRDEALARLNALSEKLATPYGKTGRSAGDVLWETRHATARFRGSPPKIDVPDYDDADDASIQDAMDALSSLAVAHAAAFAGRRRSDPHPWRGFGKIDASDEEMAEIADIARRWDEIGKRIAKVAEELTAAVPDVPNDCNDDLVRLRELLDKARDIRGSEDVALLRALQIPAARHAVKEALSILDDAKDVRSRIEGKTSEKADPNALRDVARRASEAGLADIPLATFPILTERLSKIMKFAESASGTLRSVAAELGLRRPPTLGDAKPLALLAAAIRESGLGGLDGRRKEMTDPAVRTAIKTAAKESERLARDARHFSSSYVLRDAPEPDVLDAMAGSLERAGIGALLSPAWWRAKRTHDAIAPDGIGATAADKAQTLRQIATHLRDVRRFETDRTMQRLLGEAFSGLSSPLSEMRAAALAYERVLATLPGNDETNVAIKNNFLLAPENSLLALSELFPKESGWAFEEGVPPLIRSVPAEDAARVLDRTLRAMETIREVHPTIAGLDPMLPAGNLSALADAIDELSLKEAALGRLELAELLPESIAADIMHGMRIDPLSLASGLAAATAFDDLPEGLAACCLSSDDSIRKIDALIKETVSLAADQQELLDALRVESRLSTKEFFSGSGAEESSFSALSARASECAESVDSLPAYAAWKRAWRTLERNGWDEAARALMDSGMPTEQLGRGFLAILRSLQSADVISEIPADLRQNGVVLDARETEIMKLDEEIHDMTRRQAISLMDERRPEEREAEILLSFVAKRNEPENDLTRYDDELAAAMSQALPCALLPDGDETREWPAVAALDFDLVVVLDAGNAESERFLPRGNKLLVMADDEQEPMPNSFLLEAERAGIERIVLRGRKAFEPEELRRDEAFPRQTFDDEAGKGGNHAALDVLIDRVSAIAKEFGCSASPGAADPAGFAVVIDLPKDRRSGKTSGGAGGTERRGAESTQKTTLPALLIDSDIDGASAMTSCLLRTRIAAELGVPRWKAWSVAWEIEPQGEAQRLREALALACGGRADKKMTQKQDRRSKNNRRRS